MKSFGRPVCVLLMFVLVFGFIWASDVRPVKAAALLTIQIRPDGSIYPPSAPISNSYNVTYTFTGNIIDYCIVVQRSNIIIDGAGHALRRTPVNATYVSGIDLSGRKNVTIKNIEIENFLCGLFLSGSSDNNITNNTIINNNASISLGAFSSNNRIVGNTFINNGLYITDSYGNFVNGNTVNGKPLVYLEDVTNYNVTDAGQVVLINCDNIRVENLNLSNATNGLEL